MDRRIFLESIAAGMVAPLAERMVRALDDVRPKKALLISLLAKELPYAARFKIARDAGFDAIEMQTIAGNEEWRRFARRRWPPACGFIP